MKILKLEAENVKRIRAIEIVPTGNAVMITGKNEQGKSSVLDAIWMTLGGGKAIPPKPIRDGEESASVTIDIGEYKVERVWKASGHSHLRVYGKETEDGRPLLPKPQTVLDRLVGPLSFNPLEFASMEPRHRRAVLLDLVDLGLDLQVWEARAKELREERTRVRNQLQLLIPETVDLPEGIALEDMEEEIVLADLVKDLAHADKWHERYNAVEKRMTDLEERIVGRQKVIEELEEKLQIEREYMNEDKAKHADVVNELEAFGEGPDRQEIREKMQATEEANAGIRARNENRKTARMVRDFETRLDEVSGELNRHTEAKMEAFKKAKYPIEGLAISDDGVTFNGLPFEQLSGEEQLRVSLSVSAALNPRLRVILVPEHARLDTDNLKAICDWAGERDFQLWIERVEDTPGDGIFIEDGGITHLDGSPVEEVEAADA